MGKKLDALLGRRFNTTKFKPVTNLAISRLAVLKNQRQARCSLARSDVVQLLNLGHHDPALLRVEQVIKEQNLLDVFVMIEGYCHLVVERINLIEEEKVCPEELKEAVSSLLYASTRCGEFPELQEMRAILTSRFGKEFAARAIELRNNCGVNLKMIQKLSTRQPSLENRLKVLKEIASENNIVLQIEEASSLDTEEKLETEQKQKQNQPGSPAILGGFKLGDNLHSFSDEIENMQGLGKYKDVADAAEAAFKSAAYAAAAARAAVELSRSESHDPDDDQNSPGPHKHDAMKSKLQTAEKNNLGRIEDQKDSLGFDKVHPIQNYHSESEDEIQSEKKAEESDESKNAAEFKGPIPASNSYLGEHILKETRPMEDIIFDESDAETIQDEDLSEKDSAMLSRSQKKFPLISEAGLRAASGLRNPKSHSAEGSGIQNAENRPTSVRTKWFRRH